MTSNRIAFVSAIGLAILALFMMNGAEAATLNNAVVTPNDSRVDGITEMQFSIDFDDGGDAITLNEIQVSANDLHSGVDWDSVTFQYKVLNNAKSKKADFKTLKVSQGYKTSNPNIFRFNIIEKQINKLSDAIIVVSIKDKTSNVETSTYRYKGVKL